MTTAMQRMNDRIARTTPQQAREILDLIEAGQYNAPADAAEILADAIRRNLATRTDRFWLSNRTTADGLAQVVDQAYQRVAFAAHRDTAEAWLRWYVGESDPRQVHPDQDYRVCACARLSITHSSHDADGAFVGIGNGSLGENNCPRLRPVVARPARIFATA